MSEAALLALGAGAALVEVSVDDGAAAPIEPWLMEPWPIEPWPEASGAAVAGAGLTGPEAAGAAGVGCVWAAGSLIVDWAMAAPPMAANNAAETNRVRMIVFLLFSEENETAYPSRAPPDLKAKHPERPMVHRRGQFDLQFGMRVR